MLKGAILGDQTWDKVGEIALDRLDNHLSSGEASGGCDDPYDGHQGRGHAYTARGKDQVTTSLGFWSNTRICFKCFTSLDISSPMIISIVCPPGLLKTWTKMRSARRWRCRRGCRTSATLATWTQLFRWSWVHIQWTSLYLEWWTLIETTNQFQCLKTVPELRQALTKFQGIFYPRCFHQWMLPGSVSLGGGTDAESLTASLRDLYATMDKGSTIPPIIMLQVNSCSSSLHEKYKMSCNPFIEDQSK